MFIVLGALKLPHSFRCARFSLLNLNCADLECLFLQVISDIALRKECLVLYRSRSINIALLRSEAFRSWHPALLNSTRYSLTSCERPLLRLTRPEEEAQYTDDKCAEAEGNDRPVSRREHKNPTEQCK